MSRLPIRLRLTAAFAAGMLAILAIAGTFVYLRVSSDLTSSLDESLQARTADLDAIVAASGRGGGLNLADAPRGGDEGFSQVIRRDGAIVASTLPAAADPALTPDEIERAERNPILIEQRSVPGVEAQTRILVRPATEPGTVLVAGATTADREEALSGLLGAFLIGAPLAVLLASGLGYALSARALAPVEAMRRRASRITLQGESERLPLPKAQDEIRRLGETLNEMLDRIESGLERERVFIADASHELRTPLAILKAELELADRDERTPPELRSAIRSAGDEVDRLARLAEDLLVIARSDQGRLPVKRAPVELPAMLRQVRDRFAPRASAAGRRIEVDAEAESAKLDPLRIEQALGNLVDNSLRHGSGTIGLSGRWDESVLVLEVSDEGPGFPEDFATEAFDRFTRAETGRAGEGTGLGLAIVRAIARAHGGDAAPSPSGGAAVRITIPA